GIPKPCPLASYRVVNEPFYSMLKGLEGKRVRVHGRRLPGIEANLSVMSIDGDNEKSVTVRDAAGKQIGTIAAGDGGKVTGAKGLNYEIDFKGKKAFVSKSGVKIATTAIPLAVAPTPGIIGGIHDGE